MGLKKGSKISLIMGAVSGILVFLGVWLLTFSPKVAWIFLTCLNVLLSLSFISRLIKTRKFMPSGMLLLITLAVLIFCLMHHLLMPNKFPSKEPEINMFVKLFNLGSIIFVLALLGFWLDQKFHTLPLWTIIGIALGMLYSFYEAWQIHQEK